MATAKVRNAALAAAGAAALMAAIVAAALISTIVTSPDQVALAMSEGDVFDVVTMIFRRVASVCVRVFRWL